jgi:hypothetical protein
MAPPNVTGFTGLANLSSGKKGLKKTNNSVSPVEVTGTDFADDLTVNAKNGAGVSWSGPIKSAGGKWKANLTCTNPGKGPKDTEDVSVTVGTSPVYVAKGVEVGT